MKRLNTHRTLRLMSTVVTVLCVLMLGPLQAYNAPLMNHCATASSHSTTMMEMAPDAGDTLQATEETPSVVCHTALASTPPEACESGSCQFSTVIVFATQDYAAASYNYVTITEHSTAAPSHPNPHIDRPPKA